MQTKLKIMDTTFALFAQKGAEFSLNEVALEVGIKKASIYAHFESKESLLYKVIEQEIDRYFFQINDKIDSFSAQTYDVKSILEKTFFSILEYYDSKNKLLFWKRLLLFPPKEFQLDLLQKVSKLSDDRYKIIKTILSNGMDNGIIEKQDVESIALSFFAMIHGILSSTLIYNTKDLNKYYKQLWQNFCCGIFKNL